MSNLPDAAYIRNLRNTGYRDGKDPTYPVCPICEQTCETIYISADNEIVGCDQCMTTRNVMVIKQGEYMGKDPETGKAKFQFIEDDDERETLPTIGYMAYFEYLNGFRKVVYWSKEKMMTHADTFSKAFSRQGYEDLIAGRVPEKDMWRYSSFWYKNFDDMAKKTLLRHIISRWGIMSIEMTTALEHDDAVNVADDGQIVTETVEAARASIPADAQEVPSAEPEAPAPTAEAEPEAVDISTL